MQTRQKNPVFVREVDMYPALMSLFPHTPTVVAEVPFFGKRIDLVFFTSAMRSLYAVETKLGDWRTAFKQAALNQLAAQQSFIAVPTSLAQRLLARESDLFARYDVGLIAIGETASILIPGVKNGCFSLRHYRVLKQTLKHAQAKKPKPLGTVANALSERSKSLVLLQTRAD